jgi:succinyl-diaminopimelate desuccinylase
LKNSIIELTKVLVEIPSRADIDSNSEIQKSLENWFLDKGMVFHRLFDNDNNQVGLYLHLSTGKPGPILCLNACLDTAPFGDENQWRFGPTSSHIEKGLLYGRGAADSKVGVSIFSHLAYNFSQNQTLPSGELYVVFDADEHTGRFQGIKTFLSTCPKKPDAVLIGYPGNDKLIIGSRGFLRAEVTLYGIAVHSGSSRQNGINAINKMAELIQKLEEKSPSFNFDPDFDLGPKFTVTQIKGGEGYSSVPDSCTCKLDIRLTPSFGRKEAENWILNRIQEVEDNYLDTPPPKIDWKESWPAFKIPENSFLVRCFLDAIQTEFKRKVVAAVSGPSNIGNYLASLKIPSLSGFGVSYYDIHAANERIELESIMPVYHVYMNVIKEIMNSGVEKLIEPDASVSNTFFKIGD